MEENINEVVEIVDDASSLDSLDLSPITEGNEKVVNKLDEMIQILTENNGDSDVNISDVPSIDYTEQLNKIADLLQQQNDMLITINDANNTILLYGLVIVPLLIVCMCLWWFFKQFLYKF